MFTANNNKLSISIDQPDEGIIDLDFFTGLKKASPIEEHHEGQLAIDVMETADEFLILAPMAGASPDEIELHLHNDLLTIRGARHSPAEPGSIFHFSECYWGRFSRSIVLPADVHFAMAKAEYRQGLLMVRLPKVYSNQAIPITIIEE
jgi:HSP20 family protein